MIPEFNFLFCYSGPRQAHLPSPGGPEARETLRQGNRAHQGRLAAQEELPRGQDLAVKTRQHQQG